MQTQTPKKVADMEYIIEPDSCNGINDSSAEIEIIVIDSIATAITGIPSFNQLPN